MAPTMLEELCKRIQHCCATLRRSRNKRNVGSCWLKSLTGFKLCATTRNNMQQGVQTNATCNIQQCWELLGVASVCTQPYPPFSNMFCLAVVYASVCRPNLIRLVIPPPPPFFFSSTQVAPPSVPLLAN